MTPEQEERLGQLMATRARQEGHIQKFPVDVRPLPTSAKDEDLKNLTIGFCLSEAGGRSEVPVSNHPQC